MNCENSLIYASVVFVASFFNSIVKISGFSCRVLLYFFNSRALIIKGGCRSLIHKLCHPSVKGKPSAGYNLSFVLLVYIGRMWAFVKQTFERFRVGGCDWCVLKINDLIVLINSDIIWPQTRNRRSVGFCVYVNEVPYRQVYC
ncbi:hypothetical protein BAnh1_11970 [Bartonella australis AUST/NH1]|uniref:Uncharacterized protein n=1 Tax=Bartonella australis (strain Aust/NH1) TaxID=1094489 RepID=M1N5B2_BARAA|nr:hypothetical protein BAnh1_11970 [Bartonella australis AUST/NH1]